MVSVCSWMFAFSEGWLSQLRVFLNRNIGSGNLSVERLSRQTHVLPSRQLLLPALKYATLAR